MRLSKTTNYAIRILIDCAQADGELVKVADISHRRDITPQNTFKLVHLLSRAGFVKAVRGRHGGVRLARPATEIRIGDVVRAMETTRADIEDAPAKGKKKSRQQLEDISHLFDSALEAFITVLDGHTLHDMANARGATSKTAREKKSPARSKSAAAKTAQVRRQMPSRT
jgi:Rrf2 family transcriptional regulator, nitric oxide-sensitive transcriptional repressor